MAKTYTNPLAVDNDIEEIYLQNALLRMYVDENPDLTREEREWILSFVIEVE